MVGDDDEQSSLSTIVGTVEGRFGAFESSMGIMVQEIKRLSVTPQSCGYGDVTAMYTRRSKIPSRAYAKHQYMQESEYGSTWCFIHSNI